jgi:hypothetical protein
MMRSFTICIGTYLTIFADASDDGSINRLNTTPSSGVLAKSLALQSSQTRGADIGECQQLCSYLNEANSTTRLRWVNTELKAFEPRRLAFSNRQIGGNRDSGSMG